MSELHDLEVFVGCGRTAYFTVSENIITLKFRDNVKGIAPMSIKTHPNLLVKALQGFFNENGNFKLHLLYQGEDFAVYLCERIL